MILRELSIPIIIFIVFLSALVGYTSHDMLGDDNPIEESAEEIIQNATGIDADLTPKTPERTNEKNK